MSLTCPRGISPWHSRGISFVISFALDEAAADVKKRLTAVGGSFNPLLTAKIEGLIDGAIADYQHSK